jgi:hypothetical protein
MASKNTDKKIKKDGLKFVAWKLNYYGSLVGDSRFELETPVLSGLCSNQLS